MKFDDVGLRDRAADRLELPAERQVLEAESKSYCFHDTLTVM